MKRTPFFNLLPGLSVKTLLLPAFLLLQLTAFTQEEPRQVKVVMNDGTELTGQLISIEDSVLVVETASLGRVSIERHMVENILFNPATTEGEPGNVYPFAYQVSPSTFKIPDGSLYYRTIYLLYHGIDVGVTDNFSIEAGIAAPVFLLAFIAQPRYTVQLSNRVSGSISGLVMRSTFFSDENWVYGGLSRIAVGHPHKNVSAGFGYGNHTFNKEPGAIALLSGTYPISDRFIIMTDNVFGREFFLGTTGFRYYSPKNLFFDLGFLYGKDEVSFIFLGGGARFE